MSYLPQIKSSVTKERYISDNYQAFFLDDIESVDIEYRYLLVVYRRDKSEPLFVVSSEKYDPMAAVEMGLVDIEDMEEEDFKETHFLCVFKDGKHQNYSDERDWTNAETFKYTALQYAEEQIQEELHVNLEYPHMIKFSKEELRILSLLKEGLTIKEIAERLWLAKMSVDNRCKNIMRKLRTTKRSVMRKASITLEYSDID